jgi:hypothetical protein
LTHLISSLEWAHDEDEIRRSEELRMGLAQSPVHAAGVAGVMVLPAEVEAGLPERPTEAAEPADPDWPNSTQRV